jgi:hypothetical protein
MRSTTEPAPDAESSFGLIVPFEEGSSANAMEHTLRSGCDSEPGAASPPKS